MQKTIGSLSLLVLFVTLLTNWNGLRVSGIPVWYESQFLYTLPLLFVVSWIALLSFLVRSKNVFRFNNIDAVVVILFLYCFVHIVFKNPMTTNSLVQLSSIFSVYGLVRLFGVTWKIALLSMGFLILGILEAGYGFGQLYGFWTSHHSGFPMTGSFFNPGPYGGFLAFVVVLAVGVLLSGSDEGVFASFAGKQWIRSGSTTITWIALFFCSSALILSGSRSALLAVLVGSGVLLFVRFQKIFTAYKKWMIPVGCVVVLVGCIGLYQMKKDSADGRILVWKVSGQVLKEYPLLGVGWNHFPRAYNIAQSKYFGSGSGGEREAYLADYVHYPYNEWLGFTVEMGVLGFALLLALVLVIVTKWRGVMMDKNESMIAAALLLSWAVFGLFSYPSEIPVLMLCLPMFLATWNNAVDPVRISETLNEREEKNDLKKMLSKLGFPILIVLLSTYGLYWFLDKRNSVEHWKIANANYQLGRYEGANASYKLAYDDMKNEGTFLQFAGKSLSQSRNIVVSQKILQRALSFVSDPALLNTMGKDLTDWGNLDEEYYDKAEGYLQKSIDMVPNRYHGRYLLMELYTRQNKSIEARRIAEDIIAMDTKIESDAVKEIRLRANALLLGEEVFDK